ncbi:hypothetical protein [Acidaminococcus sp. DS4831]|uniref:hypothetical protein n=1 Tax=Acidaminococcus sp. DS4831 TaxID=3141399 RepID=UPI0032E43C72
MKNYISVIYQYYPRNLPWGTYAYQQSAEYRKYKETACRFQENPPLDFYDVLKKGLPHFSILDWCNFDLYPDREYKILLAPDQPYLDDDQALFQRLAGTIDELIVFVSPLLPVFYLLEQHTCQTAEWYIFTNQATSDKTEEVKNTVRKTFHAFGYQEITYQEASQIIPAVCTELKNTGQASVFDCLFEDGVTICPDFYKKVKRRIK